MNNFTYTNELYHHGIKGQEWGVRRFQNSDGTLTEEGLRRYGKHMKATRESGMQSRNAYLGRKMFADKEQRYDRGEELHKRGRTELGAIGRAAGRVVAGQAIAGFIEGSAAVPAALLMTNPATAPIAAAGLAFIVGTAEGTMMLQNVSSIIRGVQDIRDLQTYKENRK